MTHRRLSLALTVALFLLLAITMLFVACGNAAQQPSSTACAIVERSQQVISLSQSKEGGAPYLYEDVPSTLSTAVTSDEQHCIIVVTGFDPLIDDKVSLAQTLGDDEHRAFAAYCIGRPLSCKGGMRLDQSFLLVTGFGTVAKPACTEVTIKRDAGTLVVDCRTIGNQQVQLHVTYVLWKG